MMAMTGSSDDIFVNYHLTIIIIYYSWQNIIIYTKYYNHWF